MASRFLVGVTLAAAVVWDNAATTNWSATSGGAGGASAPTSADDVIVDANSGTGTLKLASTAVCKSFSQIGVNNISVIQFTDGMTFHVSTWHVSGPGGASTKFGWLPGASGSYFSTPSAPANRITGDIDIRVKANSVNVGASTIFISKLTNDPGRSYEMGLNANRIQLIWSPTGNAAQQISAVSPSLGASSGVDFYARATLIVNNGAGAYEVRFYTSSDGITWNQLGSTVTGATTTSIADTSTEVEAGAQLGGTNSPFNGVLRWAKIYNGINGALAVSFDPDASYSTGKTWTAATGETWTINGAALISATDKIALAGTGAAGWNLVKDGGGTAASDYVSIANSTVTPASTWLAGTHSINGGGNTGWSFTQASSLFQSARKPGDPNQTYLFGDTSGFAPTTWLWDFGDGTTSTLQNPTHTFDPGGPYTVTFTASYGTMIGAPSTAGFSTITVPPIDSGLTVDFGAAHQIPTVELVDEADVFVYASGVMIPAPFRIGKATLSTDAEVLADATAQQLVKVHRISVQRIETRAYDAPAGVVKLDDPELRDFVSFLEKMP